MAIEVRYVGTRAPEVDRVDINEINIIENGFIDEFRLAQANLRANIAAGRGTAASFAFTAAPARRRCRSIWPISPAATPPGQPAHTGGELDQHRLHQPARSTRTRSRRPTSANTGLDATRHAAPTRRGAAANFFRATRTSPRRSSRQLGAYTSYTRCRWR